MSLLLLFPHWTQTIAHDPAVLHLVVPNPILTGGTRYGPSDVRYYVAVQWDGLNWTQESWTSAVDDLMSGWTINRGRFESDGQYAPGRATVTLNNVSGRYTPRNTASALYPNVTKGRRIALYCVFAGRRYYRFVGKIREISQESRPGGMTTHLECTDILADLAKERAFLNTQYSEMTSSIVNELLGNRDTDLVFRTLLDTDGATGIWELNNTDVEFSWDFTEVFVQNYDVYNGLTPFNLLH